MGLWLRLSQAGQRSINVTTIKRSSILQRDIQLPFPKGTMESISERTQLSRLAEDINDALCISYLVDDPSKQCAPAPS